jgi:RimJ/RimL family protein N-acetyltransferase
VGDQAFEIGYWSRFAATGIGLATEAAAALTRVAFEVALADRLEIHVDPTNQPSGRVPQKLGFTEEARLRRRLPPRTPNQPARDVVIFSMMVEQFDGSPASVMSSKITALDCVGRSAI